MRFLDEVLQAYYTHFGMNYPLCISDNRTDEEIIADVELCIDTNKEAEQPIYEDEEEY